MLTVMCVKQLLYLQSLLFMHVITKKYKLNICYLIATVFSEYSILIYLNIQNTS